MAIAKDKRRCMVTLTASNVDRFQALSAHLGLSPKLMSETCDRAISQFADVMQIAKDGTDSGIEDLFSMMGKQLQIIFDEQKEVKRVPKQKRNTIPHAKKHA